jgi:hypothetical protein
MARAVSRISLTCQPFAKKLRERSRVRALTLAATLVAAAASAADVYVNGTNVQGLTGQRFEKVNVRIDERGDVYIEAPGYAVRRVPVGAEAAPDAGVVTQRYFLVTEQTQPGATGYDIDVFLNGRYLRTLPGDEGQIVADLTSRLAPGKNQVTLQARRSAVDGGAPRGDGKASLFRVIIGEGQIDGEKVVIEKSVVVFAVTAADTDDVVQQFSFTTR